MGSNGFDLWMLRLDAETAGAFNTTEWLDESERGRLATLRFSVDAERYRIAHSALRLVLASYLRIGPADVTFGRECCPLCRKAHGRPIVLTEPSLHFSLSYGHAIVAFAVASTPVGIDIERLPMHDPGKDFPGELLFALHPRENEHLQALPPTDRSTAFYQCFVRKEALLKGLGTGFGRDPQTIDVGFDNDCWPRSDVRATAVVEPWTITNLDCFPGHAAAMVQQRPSSSVASATAPFPQLSVEGDGSLLVTAVRNDRQDLWTLGSLS